MSFPTFCVTFGDFFPLTGGGESLPLCCLELFNIPLSRLSYGY